MSDAPRTIYHLVPESRFPAVGDYRPEGFEAEGFVHCSRADQLLAVAERFMSGVAEPLLVLAIDVDRLSAPVRWEAPVPPAPGLAGPFPHVYGEIDRGAIAGVGRLERSGGRFGWPPSFEPLA